MSGLLTGHWTLARGRCGRVLIAAGSVMLMVISPAETSK